MYHGPVDGHALTRKKKFQMCRGVLVIVAEHTHYKGIRVIGLEIFSMCLIFCETWAEAPNTPPRCGGVLSLGKHEHRPSQWPRVSLVPRGTLQIWIRQAKVRSYP